MAKISVIVPIYNAEKYLAQCIESLIHQTHRDLQILLINDGSTDSSLAIAERYAAQDSRIEIISQPNKGQAAARNIGLLHATGDWISFVDADDYLETDCYTQLIPYSPSQDIIHFGFRRVTDSHEVLFERIPRHPYRYTTPWSRLYRRKWLVDNAISFPEGMYYEDVVFTTDVWLHQPQQTILPYIGYNYLFNRTSTTAIVHKADQKRLFYLLCNRLSHAPWCHKWLIIYTIIRLKLHFIRYD